jgi:hypothetical protein
MKIIRNGNGAITVRFNGVFGIRQAILLPKLIALFPKKVAVTLDFSDAQCERESAFTALIPALASMRSRPLEVVGLVAAAEHSFDEGMLQAA